MFTLAYALIFSLIVSTGFQPAFGALYNSMTDLPLRSYDYIIVGGGTAGGVLGRRLTEDGSKNVLVIEAGANPDDIIETQIPFYATKNFFTKRDWNFTTVSQAGLNGRAVTINAGRMLGGSSSMTQMVWIRGGKDDYDLWATVTGDSGWSWDALLPYMKKIEHFSADNPDNSVDMVSTYHGTNGPLGITIDAWSYPSDPHIINATVELASEFPFNPDVSSGNELGMGWSPSTIENGARSSSWTHYLRPVINRTNLDVVINTHVTRLLQTGTDGDKPVFRGVEYATSVPSSNRNVINATHEVILSAGAIMSPQILMLSGIGSRSTLSGLGIQTIVDNPEVGQHFHDHPRFASIYTVADDVPTMDIYIQNATLEAEALAQWKVDRTGPLVAGGPKQMSFSRNPTDIAPFNTSQDPSSGPTCGHYQLAFADQFASEQTTVSSGRYLTIITNAISQASYGNITIGSASPFDPPLINPNFLGEYYDVATLREGVKASQRLASSKSMTDNFVMSPFGNLVQALDQGDEAIESLARSESTTTWQPMGSTRMTRAGGTDGVLDPTLKVFGTVGLRVVDAGAFPHGPAASSQAPVYILAERAADLIKADAP
ncbi:alcohol oxidase [Vararia minispora EC-137]|uniref:Alcohol oxidase n=1 Tax=Vararia minispora EC-137 TaxID=1314806 RepID=A0ACB8QF05_9AGAM|nr:alcohol oxidase [Vararia minispora EC-137]